MHSNRVSRDVSSRVKAYIRWQCHSVQGVQGTEAEAHVMAELPAGLKRLLLQNVRGSILLKHPVFSSLAVCHARCLERLCCDILQQTSIINDTEVFGYGEACNRMLFISSGALLYEAYNFN